MKHLILISILFFSIGVNAQIDATPLKTTEPIEEDSLTAERFFLDSTGGQYMVEYRYVEPEVVLNLLGNINTDSATAIAHQHQHYIAICSIVKYRGNKSQTILSNYKAIYSPVECAADNTKLWLKRLYDFKNSKK